MTRDEAIKIVCKLYGPAADTRLIDALVQLDVLKLNDVEDTPMEKFRKEMCRIGYIADGKTFADIEWALKHAGVRMADIVMMKDCTFK